ncbi:MAG TPA: plastocyanin/azurin family copper-binding protein [Vicinamibacterales bacterium]|nr:plastocyanin/azurin family copper-binding protein [Vicinamibacterales bacterium]
MTPTLTVTRTSILALLFALAVPWAGGAADPTPRTITIVAGDEMKYSVTEITAKRGERLRVVLIARGTVPKAAMAHNLILLAKGTDPAAFVKASALARDTGFIAPALAKQVLASTRLAGKGESVTVVFDAPKAAGRYDYVCSFPGHFLNGMRGVLVVK